MIKAANLIDIATAWIDKFSAAMLASDVTAVSSLLHPDVAWRDLLALSWDLHSYYGTEQVNRFLSAYLADVGITALQHEPAVEPRRAVCAGQDVIEVLFRFRTQRGNCRGVVRLISSQGRSQAWTVMTSLDQLAGLEERLGANRLVGDPSMRDFTQPSWLELRTSETEYRDREPAVLVVGAGQAGLAVAARLRSLCVDTLIVDRHNRVGDNWRNRYRSLVLHNEVWANHMPYMPFPDTWPVYVPKDLLGAWFEAYAQVMGLNVWSQTEFLGASYQDAARAWQVTLRGADGQLRTVHPRHIVMATGVSGRPRKPALPGLGEFAGKVIHSSEYDLPDQFTGKRVLVIGTGTSGHDIAQDLWSGGADVAIVQRSSITVTNVGPDAAGRVYSLYLENENTEISDLINIATPYPMLRWSYQLLSRELAVHDGDLLSRLNDVGFETDYGSDETGFQMKYLRQGGGYYLNVGCSDLIADRKIRLIRAQRVERFTSSGVNLTTGESLPLDAVVLATGFEGQEAVIADLFGADVALRVGPVWGFSQEGELRNMWRRTGQAGLWFTAGSLAQCRIYSKYLALQIKACEERLLPPAKPSDAPGGLLRDIDVVDIRDRRP